MKPFFLLALLLAGCAPRHAPEPRCPQMELFATPAKITIKKVEAASPFGGTPRICEEGSYALDSSRRSALAALLSSCDSYITGMTKSCLFIPEYALVLEAEGKEATLLFSHSCKQLKMPSNRIIDCDPVAEKIYTLIQQP